MPQFVLFVHGYSERSLGAYFKFPTILADALKLPQNHVALSGYDSLDNLVSIDDLAATLDSRVKQLEANAANPWDTSQAAVICHSTGALVARRWILNRFQANAASPTAVPSHLVTLAGANHGSTLAEVGKSPLGYIQKILQSHILTVGARVLTDLDYGSDFLLQLNREWLEAWNDGLSAKLFAFSIGGDTVGSDPTLQIIWQTHEPGSDNTVRISSANLNYTMIDVPNGGGKPVAITPDIAVPHLILPGYSHFGPDTGIIGNVHAPADPPMAAVLEALAVGTADQYATLQVTWAKATAQWTDQHTAIANSTGVFTVFDRSGESIGDCMIALLDQQQLGDPGNAVDAGAAAQRVAATNVVSPCILPHSPLHNDVQVGSYTFYLNYDEYTKTSPHWFHIEVNGESTNYPYAFVTFTQPPELIHTLAPNQTTYVRIVLDRSSDQAYTIYGWTPDLDLTSIQWLPPFPFPPEDRIAPP